MPYKGDKQKITIEECGVYKITNAITGDFYIGSSVNIPNRMKVHRRKLSKNMHGNPHLQNAWNKYGEQAFEFKALLLCDPESQLYYEQVCIDALKPAYNIAINTSAPTQGLAMSEEARRKMSVAKSGKNHPFFGKILSEEHKRKLSEANSGKTLSEEHKRKISETLTGTHPAEESRKKMSEAKSGENNPNFGKIASKETRAKLSEAHKGNTNSLGYKHTEETRAKISESLKLHYAKKRGELCPTKHQAIGQW